jgi:hypothetical protein
MLLKESVKIRRDPMARRRVQPSRRVDEIDDVVVKWRNGKPAELLRQPQAQECRDRGKGAGEGHNCGDTAHWARQFFVEDNQRSNPFCGNAMAFPYRLAE